MQLHIFLQLFLVFHALASDKLHFVLTFVSQGTITPKSPIPTMNWNDWEEKGPNELTAMGMREQYLLGRELSRRYRSEKLIDSEYLIDQVHVRMTDRNCTIMSGQAFLRGFLGESSSILSEKQLEVATPPFHVDDYFKDKIGSKVLPAGISTLPFHTHYPLDEDVFASTSCPHARKVNSDAFVKDQDVKKNRDLYEAKFLKLVKERYKMETDFPKYVPILESIASAIRQLKETTLPADDANLIKSFSKLLYHPSRALSEEANKYRVSGLLNFTRTFMNESMNAIVKNEARKQNVKAAFIFTDDTMLASLLALLNSREVIGSATTVSFEVYGPKTPVIDKLLVNIKRNDVTIEKDKSFKVFLDDIASVVKGEFKKWCASK
eukprot:TRINITY_DN133_c0_g1_i11.p1 TRINITY_DN133_c0_g1~~TRINITY_DN133_c0_g1_i11.p1  ORF type:complete len:379 (+),score=122.18 TRINITY_DN133_c0_g1_i11:124-1260(+)